MNNFRQSPSYHALKFISRYVLYHVLKLTVPSFKLLRCHSCATQINVVQILHLWKCCTTFNRAWEYKALCSSLQDSKEFYTKNTKIFFLSVLFFHYPIIPRSLRECFDGFGTTLWWDMRLIKDWHTASKSVWITVSLISIPSSLFQIQKNVF